MYKEKYIKYKTKYIALKNQLGGGPKVSETKILFEGNSFIFKAFEEDGGFEEDGELTINKEGETSLWNGEDVILGFVNNDIKKKVIYVKVYNNIEDRALNESSYFTVYLDKTYQGWPAISYLYEKIIAQEEKKELQLTFCDNLKQLLEVFLKYLQDNQNDLNRQIMTVYIEQLQSSIEIINSLKDQIKRTSTGDVAFKSKIARDQWPEHRGDNPYGSLYEYLKMR